MKKGVCLNRSGFTLIEVIVVAAIIAILAGILVPMIFSQVDESKITKAKGECDTIAKALTMFRKDTGKWPTFDTGTYPCATVANGGDATVGTVLKSPGTLPTLDAAAVGWDFTTLAMNLSNKLISNPGACYPAPASSGNPGWKGPYMAEVNNDPWGNSYVVHAPDLDATGGVTVYVMSAGPNGKLETSTNSNPQGDDIGVAITANK